MHYRHSRTGHICIVRRFFHQIVESFGILSHCLFRNCAVVRLLFSVRVFRLVVKTYQRAPGRLSVAHSLYLVMQTRDRQHFTQNGALRKYAFLVALRSGKLLPLVFDLIYILQHEIGSALKRKGKTRLRIFLDDVRQIFVVYFLRRLPILDKIEKRP